MGGSIGSRSRSVGGPGHTNRATVRAGRGRWEVATRAGGGGGYCSIVRHCIGRVGRRSGLCTFGLAGKGGRAGHLGMLLLLLELRGRQGSRSRGNIVSRTYVGHGQQRSVGAAQPARAKVGVDR